MSRLLTGIRHFLTEEEDGFSIVEYALGLVLLTILGIATISLLGNQISNLLSSLSASL